jgi:ribosomal protein L37AE/L43A
MQGGNPKAPKKPVCQKCGANVATAARTVINGLWMCAKCTYEHDYPDRALAPQKRKKAAPIQEETLFPLPPKKPNYA